MSNVLGIKARHALVASAACTFLMLAGCSSSSDSSPETGGSGANSGSSCTSYPCTVTIEYKAESPTLTNVSIMYTNATGGFTNLDANTPLPFDMKISRTVNQYDTAALNAISGVGGDIILTILVNDTVVKNQTASGTSFSDGTISYIFQ